MHGGYQSRRSDLYCDYVDYLRLRYVYAASAVDGLVDAPCGEMEGTFGERDKSPAELEGATHSSADGCNFQIGRVRRRGEQKGSKQRSDHRSLLPTV
jgi:hypothetical protein